MPNYSKLEQELLTDGQRALTDQCRGAALAELDDPALYKLIDDLKAAAETSKTEAADGQVAPAPLLAAALRRANAERRRRNLPMQAEKTLPASGGEPAKPIAKGAKRKPAEPARKPAGREKAETRKADLRTGSRRIAKSPKKPAEPVSAAAGTDQPPVQPAPPDNAAATGMSDKKAIRKAEKEAEKASKKAARKAEKDEAKAARKAEKKATRQAEKKAARQAEKAAAKGGKKKGKGGKDKAANPSDET